MKTRLLKWWSIGVGGMDAVTGLLLVFMPAFVLQLLGIPVPGEDALAFLSWMGVFIAGVGLSYGFALGRRREGELVWKITALVRLMVSDFLVWKIFTGSLVATWGVVAASDAVVAIAQILVLRAGWWTEVPE